MRFILSFLLVLFLSSACFSAEILFVLTNDQIYKSSDGGNSWKGIYVDSADYVNYSDICFDRSTKTIYASVSFGIIKSVDGGKHWSKIYPSGESCNFNRVSVSLDGASVVYALSENAFYRSGNGGKNWKTMTLPSTQLFFLAPFYKSGRIYVAGGGSVYVSGDGGMNWKRVGRDVFEGEVICDVAVNPSNPLQLYVAASNGLFYSGDGGKSWKNRTISPKDWIQTQKIVWSGDNPKCLYAVDADVKENGNAYLRRSVDGGLNWSVIAAKDEILLMAVDPLKYSTVFFTYLSTLDASGIESSLSTIARSGDAGRTWKSMKAVMPGYSSAKILSVVPW